MSVPIRAPHAVGAPVRIPHFIDGARGGYASAATALKAMP